MQISLGLWEFLTAIGSIFLAMCTFFVWAGKMLINANRVWNDLSATVDIVKRTIDELKEGYKSTEGKIRELEARVNNHDTRLVNVETQFLTRIEILETLKRVEMLMMNFLQGKLNEVPDLTSPIIKTQKEINEKVGRP